MNLVELAPRMRPAGRELDIGTKPFEAGIAVDLHNAFELFQMCSGTLSLTVGTVEIDGSRRVSAILMDQLDLHPFTEGKKVRLTEAEETRLSAWLSSHGRIAWIVNEAPWLLEAELLKDGPPLALNIKGNNHPFAPTLSEMRRRLFAIGAIC